LKSHIFGLPESPDEARNNNISLPCSYQDLFQRQKGKELYLASSAASEIKQNQKDKTRKILL